MDPRKPDARTASTSQQVAVIAVRRGSAGLELCLTRRKHSRKWAIPKGFIDRGDTPEQAALNEALEEAGVVGQLIGGPIGAYVYTKRTAPLTVSVYLMEVREEQKRWREMRIRERRWHSVQEAALLLASHPIHPLWDRVRESLATLS